MKLTLLSFSGATVLAAVATIALSGNLTYAFGALAEIDMRSAFTGLAAEAPRLLALWCGLLAMLLHVPGLLTVRRQRALLKAPAFLKGFDEAPVSMLVCVAWIVTGQTVSSGWSGILAGMLYGAALVLGYAMVRAAPIAEKRVKAGAVGVQLDQVKMLFAKAQTGHYLLRAATAVISIATLTMALLSKEVPLTAHISIALVLVLAHLGLAASAFATAGGMAAAARRTQKFRIEYEVAEAGLEAWIYVCGTTKGYLGQCLALRSSLARQGRKAGFLLRDTAARKELSSAKTAVIHEARTLGSLDNFVHPGGSVKTVFYLNDAVRNGHFTRFPEFDHVLVASKSMVRADRMPRNFAMYDLVVMPSRADALRWRLASDPDLAARIVTVGLGGGLQAPAPRSLHVHCGRETPDARLSPDLLPRLESLAEEASEAGLTLMLSLPDTTRGTPAEQVLSGLVRTALGRRATVFEADAAVAEELAGISGVTTRAGAARARAEGRPALWLGDQPVPEGCIACPPGGLAAALDALGSGPSPATCSALDFETFAELLAWRERSAG